MNRSPIAVVVLLVLSFSLHAQSANEGFVMESEGTRHLLNHPDPIYPPIAKAAHIQGSVLLHVAVNENGAVTKVEAIGGTPMLKSAAIEAVKNWTYKPFEKDGKPVAVQVVVSVPFSLGIPSSEEKSDQEISQAYFPKADQCRAANAAQRWNDAIKACGDLVTIAERFSDQTSRHLEIMDAHEEYGESLSFSGRLPEALTELHIATSLADKYLKPRDDEFGAVYYWRAFAEHSSRMLAEADQDYTTAEFSFRQAILSLPDMKSIYSRHLAHTLAFHSVLEQQTGHPDQADAMRAEALSLDPHALDGMH